MDIKEFYIKPQKVTLLSVRQYTRGDLEEFFVQGDDCQTVEEIYKHLLRRLRNLGIGDKISIECKEVYLSEGYNYEKAKRTR